MKKIKNKNELPPEFNLNNYKDLHKLNASAWITELSKRIRRYQSTDKDAPIRDPYPWGFEIISATMNARELNARRDKHRTPDQKTVSRINTKSIRMMTIGDAVTLNTHVEYSPEFKNLEKTKYLCITDQERRLYEQTIELHFNQHLFLGGKAPITIDFQKSNEELMEEFKLFIAAYRAQLNTYKPHPDIVPNTKNIKKWLKWKVLQYIDLDLWAEYNNVTISQPLLLTTLFPDDVVGADRMRDTVIPIANTLLSQLHANRYRFIDQDKATTGADFLKKNSL